MKTKERFVWLDEVDPKKAAELDALGVIILFDRKDSRFAVYEYDEDGLADLECCFYEAKTLQQVERWLDKHW